MRLDQSDTQIPICYYCNKRSFTCMAHYACNDFVADPKHSIIRRIQPPFMTADVIWFDRHMRDISDWIFSPKRKSPSDGLRIPFL